MDVVMYSRRVERAPAPAPALAVPPAPASESRRVALGLALLLALAAGAAAGAEAALGRTGSLHGFVLFAAPLGLPILAFMAGLVLAPGGLPDSRPVATGRALDLAWLYGVWVAILAAFTAGPPAGSPLSGSWSAGIAGRVADALGTAAPSLAFVILLAGFCLASAALRGVSRQIVLAAACMVQILPIRTGLPLVDAATALWVFFLGGLSLGPIADRLLILAPSRPLASWCALAAFGTAQAALVLAPSPLAGVPGLLGLPLVPLASGAAGIVATLLLAGLAGRTPLGGPVGALGRHALALYCVAALPAAVLQAGLVRTHLLTDPGLVGAAVAGGALLMALLVVWLSRGTAFAFLVRRPDWARSDRSGIPAGGAARALPQPG